MQVTGTRGDFAFHLTRESTGGLIGFVFGQGGKITIKCEGRLRPGNCQQNDDLVPKVAPSNG